MPNELRDTPTLEEMIGNPDELLTQLEKTCQEVADFVLKHYPPALIGFLWTMLTAALIGRAGEGDEDRLPPVSHDEDSILLAMEYVHAVLSCHTGAPTELAQIEETEGEKLLELCERIRSLGIKLCLVGPPDDPASQLDFSGDRVKSAIRTNWILIRGHRFQVLEQEYLEMVLAPHDEKLRQIYGIGATEMASGVQAMATVSRVGVRDAFEKLRQLSEKNYERAEAAGIPIDEFLADPSHFEPNDAEEVRQALLDAFFGGYCCVTESSGLPSAVLDDLSFQQGENKEFWAPGRYAGTPFRTVPGRIKPLIKIADKHYFVDPNFMRDSTYRAIQRALIARDPSYKETWNKRQKSLAENAFAAAFAGRLQKAVVLQEVHYPLPDGNWAEVDCIVTIDDTLLCIEAKAGVSALAPPSENIRRHIGVIESTILGGYRQCSRFLAYLHSAKQVELFQLDQDGVRKPIARLRSDEFRAIIPINLTLESLSPFAAMVKELPEVVPIVGRYNFISMSVDELLVVRWILPTLGELFHYLEVRQALAGIPQARDLPQDFRTAVSLSRRPLLPSVFAPDGAVERRSGARRPHIPQRSAPSRSRALRWW